MNEELSTLLTSLSEEVPDNPTRVADVHARIAGIRRRRTAVTTLALVLIVAAGVLFTRLPGKPETLPAGVPSAPYFTDGGPSSVPGYRGQQYFTFTGDAGWSASVLDSATTVVIARCDRRGELALRNVSNSTERHLSCRVPVGDHFEGALPVENSQDRGLLADHPGGANVSVRPSSAGSWTIGVLSPLYPEHLTEKELPGTLLSGFEAAAGKRLTVTIPAAVSPQQGMLISIVCVRDVRLEFLVADRMLATIACTDQANPPLSGQVNAMVTDGAVAALGLRPGQQVTVDVRSTGKQTPEWAVLDVS